PFAEHLRRELPSELQESHQAGSDPEAFGRARVLTPLLVSAENPAQPCAASLRLLSGLVVAFGPFLHPSVYAVRPPLRERHPGSVSARYLTAERHPVQVPALQIQAPAFPLAAEAPSLQTSSAFARLQLHEIAGPAFVQIPRRGPF